MAFRLAVLSDALLAQVAQEIELSCGFVHLG